MISADTLQRFLDRTDSGWAAQARRYALVAAVVAVVSALRPGPGDPSSRWWPILALLTLSALAAAIHSQSLRRRHLLFSGVLFNVAGAIWWISYVDRRYPGFEAFLEGLVIILSVSGVLCVLLELRVPRNAD